MVPPPVPQRFNTGRSTGYNPDSALTSTYIPLFNRVMFDTITFNNITLDDLRGDNSLVLFSDFANRLVSSPPLKPNGGAYGSDTIKNAIGMLIHRLKQKFHREAVNLLELFPAHEVAK